jgi:hypothetical protein
MPGEYFLDSYNQFIGHATLMSLCNETMLKETILISEKLIAI